MIADCGFKAVEVWEAHAAPEAMDRAAIKAGRLTGTSYQQPEQEGRTAVQLAIKKLNGEPLEKSYLIPCPAITKQNATQFKGQF